MRNEIKKYYTENFGDFSMLSDKEFNELRNYDLSLFPGPCLLYLKSGYQHTGKEESLSHKALKVILQKNINQSNN